MEDRIEQLIKRLSHWDWTARFRATEALGRVGDMRAVMPLIRALSDRDEVVRAHAATALGKLDDARAVAPLLKALEDSESIVRQSAAEALNRLGSADTLPRRILAEPALTPEERIEILETLRNLRYPHQGGLLRYPLPNLSAYCERMLRDEDPRVQRGARAVLESLTLLRPTVRDRTAEKDMLLRPAQSAAPEAEESLLRAAQAPDGGT